MMAPELFCTHLLYAQSFYYDGRAGLVYGCHSNSVDERSIDNLLPCSFVK